MRKAVLVAVVALTVVSAAGSTLGAQGRGLDRSCAGPAGEPGRNPHCINAGAAPVEVPEPASVGLLVAGLGALGFAAHRRRGA
jgi:hypothetical protein